MEKIVTGIAFGFFIFAFALFFFWALKTFWWIERVDKKSKALSKILQNKECFSKSDRKRYLVTAIAPLGGYVLVREVGFGTDRTEATIRLSLKEITFSYLSEEARDLFKFFYPPDILKLYGISK